MTVHAWWRDAVLYQVYPRSYQDSDGDGIGDIRGLIGRLDHLAWLGVDAVWLSPITASPNADWGYDVSDYRAVHPDLGTLDDVDTLVAEAGRRGLKVLLDFVPNHTSDRHPWFVDARSSRESTYRDWYVWRDPKPDGSAPNNWTSTFGGPAWTLDDGTGQHYLHNFLPQQPDLNWWNEDVREAFDEVLRFWFRRGVSGFRIDVAHMIVKDRQLRDNPPMPTPSNERDRRIAQVRTYNTDRPEVHDVLRRFRGVAEEFDDPERLLLGETYVLDVGRMASYYGVEDDELHLAMNFEFVQAPFDAARLAEIVGRTEDCLPGHAWPVWLGSNHDHSRLATRWCNGDERLVRCALTMLLTLRGTPLLYQGDEIGMPDTELTREQLLDPVGVRYWPRAGRDMARTPMHWAAERGGGFCPPDITPWLPLGDNRTVNVAAQRGDPDSTLSFCRDLISLRKAVPDLRAGSYQPGAGPPGAWVYHRGAGTIVAINPTARPVRVEGVSGRIAIAADRWRDGLRVDGVLELGACDCAVLVAGESR